MGKVENTLQRIAIWFSSRKLKQKVSILFVVIMCAYFLMFFVVYNFVLKKNTQEYIDNTNMSLLYSIDNNMNGTINNINTLNKWIMNNQEVKDYLKSDAKESSPIVYGALDSIYELIINEQHIASIYLIKTNLEYLDMSNGRTIVDYTILQSQEWRAVLEERAGGYVIATDGGGAFKTREEEGVHISFMRVVNDTQTQKPIGFLVMNYTSEILSDTYNSINDENKKIGYVDNYGRLISGDEALKELYAKQQINMNERLYTHPIDNTPYTAIVYEQEDILSYISQESLVILILFIAVTAISFILIGVFIARYITRPVERLVQSMDAVKQGWLKRVSIDTPNDEIGHLKNSYNNMLVEVNRLIGELIEKETAVQKAELEIFQEQIKPHFLYNTLGTIGYLALQHSDSEVYEAIESLELFYRRFLSKGSKEIMVFEEVEIIENYLKLQNLRYKDVFESEYQIEEDVANLMVPKLILQPLVENALYHGVRLKGEAGIIRVRVYQENEILYLSVYDSGIGMTEQQIKELMHKESKSFGLRKTIERIQTYYERQDVYEIKSEEGHYCEVTIKIPLSKEEEKVNV